MPFCRLYEGAELQAFFFSKRSGEKVKMAINILHFMTPFTYDQGVRISLPFIFYLVVTKPIAYKALPISVFFFCVFLKYI